MRRWPILLELFDIMTSPCNPNSIMKPCGILLGKYSRVSKHGFGKLVTKTKVTFA